VKDFRFQKSVFQAAAVECLCLAEVHRRAPSFKRVKGVHPSSISSLATFALLQDIAGISTEFSGAITTQFCFT